MMIIRGVQGDIFEHEMGGDALVSIVGHLSLNQLGATYLQFRDHIPSRPSDPFAGATIERPAVHPLRAGSVARMALFFPDVDRTLSDADLERVLRATLDRAGREGLRRVAFNGARGPEGSPGDQARVRLTVEVAQRWDRENPGVISELHLVALSEAYVVGVPNVVGGDHG